MIGFRINHCLWPDCQGDRRALTGGYLLEAVLVLSHPGGFLILNSSLFLLYNHLLRLLDLLLFLFFFLPLLQDCKGNVFEIP